MLGLNRAFFTKKGMGLLKDIISDALDAIEDVASAVVGVMLAIFIAGTFYGYFFKDTEYFLYPIYIFVALLVLKLVKDIIMSLGKKKK